MPNVEDHEVISRIKKHLKYLLYLNFIKYELTLVNLR